MKTGSSGKTASLAGPKSSSVKVMKFTDRFLPLTHLYFVAFHRKTTDIPEHYREEGELVVPSYGYFIRGAQTTFSGVLRSVHNICFLPL